MDGAPTPAPTPAPAPAPAPASAPAPAGILQLASPQNIHIAPRRYTAREELIEY